MLKMLAVGLAFFTVGAHATLWQWSVDAVVRDVVGNPVVAEGTAISAVYIVDDTTPSNQLGDNTFFDGAVVDVTVTVPSLDLAFDDSSPFNWVVVRDGPLDIIGFLAPLTVNGSPTGVISVDLFDSDGLITDDLNFPMLPTLDQLDPFDPNQLLFTEFFIAGENFEISAEVTGLNAQIVPLPGGIVLMLGALVGLAPMMRRRAAG